MGISIKGFFDGASVVVEAMTSIAPAATQGVPAETPIPSTEQVPIDDGTYTKRVSEPTPILAKTPTPQKGVASLIFF